MHPASILAVFAILLARRDDLRRSKSGTAVPAGPYDLGASRVRRSPVVVLRHPCLTLNRLILR